MIIVNQTNLDETYKMAIFKAKTVGDALWVVIKYF
jgi:hypothetical protein